MLHWFAKNGNGKRCSSKEGRGSKEGSGQCGDRKLDIEGTLDMGVYEAGLDESSIPMGLAS